MSARVVAIANEKGGVGKTTTAVNLSVGLANAHKKVLLLDLDPQGNAGIHLGIQRSNKGVNSTYNILTGTHRIEDQKIRLKGIDFVPSCKDLDRFNFPYAFYFKEDDEGLECSIEADRLERSLDDIKNDYDFVFIDCPPNWNLLTMNALVACTDVFIPLQAHFLAVKGMNNLLEDIHQIKGAYGNNTKTMRILLCQHEGRCNLSKEIAAMMKARFNGKMFNTIIRKNITLAESPMKGEDIFAYRNLSHGAKDYLQLVEEVIQKYPDLNIPSNDYISIPHVPYASVNEGKTKIGYENNSNRYLYKDTSSRSLKEIGKDLNKMKNEIYEMRKEMAVLP